MTPNRSLGLSLRIQEMMRKDMLQFIEPIYPSEVVRSHEAQSTIRRRDRAFNEENTLLTMIVTAFQEDKSLQNSVTIFQEVFRRNGLAAKEAEEARIEEIRKASAQEKTKRGRPRLFKVKIPKSKQQDISSNTAAFSKARERIEQGLIESVFKATARRERLKSAHRWHGRTVYNTDGTYFQMQDSPGIPEKYRAQKSSDGTMQGYPQGLLQVLTRQGSGLLSAYKIAGRKESELQQMVAMLEEIPDHSLILADDLYNCYALFSLLLEKGIDIITPEKKDRNYTVIKQLAPGDEIVRINKPSVIHPLIAGQKIPPYLTLRRISYSDTQDPTIQHALLTTILDESIEKTEIVQKYTGRWDIEITIREIKTQMGLNIARSQTEEMVFREMGVALIAYNLLRTIIAESAEDSAFPSKTDIFQELFAQRSAPLVDRKGRVYSRWAPGRPIKHLCQSAHAHNSL